MAVRKIKGAWWVDFHYASERMRKRSPLNSKAGAEAYEVQLRQALIQHGSIKKMIEALHAKKVRTTFGEFSERWMRDYAAVNNKPSEQRAKRNALKNHLVPAFGHLTLDEITSARIEQLKGKLLGAGIGPKSINNYLSILRKCLDTAIEWDMLSALPRIRWLKSTLPDVTYLNTTEVEALAQAAPKTIAAMVHVASQTGLRFCELIALQWDDLNMDTRKICVRRAEVRGNIGTPKNNRIRYIPMTRLTFDTLAKLDRSCPLVFHRSGTSIRYVQALKQLKNSCRRAGVRPISWHVLRHTFASELARRGVPLQNTKELLGHASLTMTLRYAHLGPDTLQRSIAVLDEPGNSWATGRQPMAETASRELAIPHAAIENLRSM